MASLRSSAYFVFFSVDDLLKPWYGVPEVISSAQSVVYSLFQNHQTSSRV